MKRHLLSLAVLSCMSVVPAHAAVTITSLLGYHWMDAAADKQREALGGKGGVRQENDIHEAYSVGMEMTERSSVELEYGQTQAKGNSRSTTPSVPKNYDTRQQNYNVNTLINNSLFGLETKKFKPYALLGAGRSIIEAKDEAGSQNRKVLQSSRDTLVNLGYGARYNFNSMLALRGEGRLAYNTDNKWIEPMLLLGIQGRFGGVSAPTPALQTYVPPFVDQTAQGPVLVAPVAVAPIDSDRDGVLDPQDKCPGTPLNYKVDTDGCPIELTEPVSIPLKVLFDTNKWFIKPQFDSEIAKVAEFMTVYPKTVAVIEGHTDSRGSRQLNTMLSANRAEAVRKVLVEKFGIDPARLSSQGYGPDRPLVPNTSADNMQQNRRTVAVVSGEARRIVQK